MKLNNKELEELLEQYQKIEIIEGDSNENNNLKEKKDE